MIFGAAFSTYVIFDIGKPNLPRTRFVRSLPYLLSLYSFGVTTIYLRYRDPVFHQLAFGAIQLYASSPFFNHPLPWLHTLAYLPFCCVLLFFEKSLSTFRSAYLILTAPNETYREQKNKADATRYILIGSATFLIGFLIWNVDNV
jgi:dihydroceramidase